MRKKANTGLVLPPRDDALVATLNPDAMVCPGSSHASDSATQGAAAPVPAIAVRRMTHGSRMGPVIAHQNDLITIRESKRWLAASA